MIVYELMHVYYTYQTEIYHSPRLLGFFTNKIEVENAIVFYKTVPGYVDSPNAFVVRSRNVNGEIKNGIIWEALVYSHTFGYEDYAYTAELGLFGNESDASNAVKSYHDDNTDFFSNNPTIEIEEIVNWYQLNQRYCTDGFIVEPIADE